METQIPLKIEIVQSFSSNLLVRFLQSNEEVEMPANQLVRCVDEGVYELEEEEILDF